MSEKYKEYRGISAGGNLYRHIWLSGQVAQSIGVSLRDALRSGRLDPRRYSEIISRCQNNACDKACALHMSVLRDGQQENVQDFCANQQLFEALRVSDEDHAAVAARENLPADTQREA